MGFKPSIDRLRVKHNAKAHHSTNKYYSLSGFCLILMSKHTTLVIKFTKVIQKQKIVSIFY